MQNNKRTNKIRTQNGSDRRNLRAFGVGLDHDQSICWDLDDTL